MSKNQYSGVESYAAFFIDYKIRKLIQLPLFNQDDYEDLEQELMLAYLLAMPKFDPEKGNRKAFIKAAVNNKATVIIRDAEARKRWSGSANLSLHAPINEDQDSLLDVLAAENGLWGETLYSYSQKAWEDKADFLDIINQMPEDLRELAVLLLEHDLKDAVQKMALPPSTVYSRLSRLRKFMGSLK